MGMKVLVNTLIACYPANSLKNNPVFLKTLNEHLTNLTREEGRSLAGRIVTSYKFAPSIAEIIHEWKMMRQETNRRVYTAPREMGKMSPAVAKEVEAAKRRRRNKEPAPLRKVDADMLRFVRQFFPDISESTVQRNYLEIANCRNDRNRELKENSKFRTIMVMDDHGEINLVMRKIV